MKLYNTEKTLDWQGRVVRVDNAIDYPEDGQFGQLAMAIVELRQAVIEIRDALTLYKKGVKEDEFPPIDAPITVFDPKLGDQILTYEDLIASKVDEHLDDSDPDDQAFQVALGPLI
jgi:hypothetical protein